MPTSESIVFQFGPYSASLDANNASKDLLSTSSPFSYDIFYGVHKSAYIKGKRAVHMVKY